MQVPLVQWSPVLVDLEVTFGSGQAFHWQRAGVGWVGAVGEQAVYVEEGPGGAGLGGLKVNKEGAAAAWHYLALEDPLEAIYASFPQEDAVLAEAVAFCRGMRILRQPAWEAVATFITSSMKQVAHIAAISHTLRRRFGRRLALGEREVFAYPEPAVLAGLEEADLRACALGYRAGHLLGAARMVASGEVDLRAVEGMEDGRAREELCRLPGVGEKVANCALLFGFGRLRAFPVDVWIDRVIRERYFAGKRRVTAERVRKFCAQGFGPYGGYAQQYLFHHARLTWKNGRPGAGPRSAGGGKAGS
ncbi:MAG: hypothetical protein RLZZ142_1734 [Verrucomicrobiota bacterium]|jgi:N-glycosylase/DNA lyase